MPLVSVVIPCFNAADTVGVTIQSALDQDYGFCEVVVVDDGSHDASLDVICSFGDRIRHESGPNRGGSAARNRGLAFARGQFILFLDADDILYPSMIRRMVDAALASPGSAPLCDREDWFETPSSHVVPHRNRYDGRDPLIFFLEASPQTSAVMHRRDDLEAVGGFDESLPCCQERDLHLRLAARGMQIVAVPEILFRLRRRAGSVSSSYVKVLRQRVGIHERLRDALESIGALSPARRATLAHTLSLDGRHSVRHGELALAERAFSAAAGTLRDGDRAAFHNPTMRSLATMLGPVRAERLACGTAAALRGGMWAKRGKAGGMQAG